MKIKNDFTKRFALSISFMAAILPGMGATATDTVFVERFNTQTDFDHWKVVDLNPNPEGGRTWEYFNQGASYMLDYLTHLPGDDWLISPAFKLDNKSVYELSFDMGIASKIENLRIALGTSEDPSTFTQVLGDFAHVKAANSGLKKFKIYVPQSGSYRLGFYAYSDADQHRIDIDNVVVRLLSSKDVPDTVQSFMATPSPQGSIQATISLKAPSLTASGTPLTQLTGIDLYRNNEATPIHTFTGTDATKVQSFTDESPLHGFNTYKAVAYNQAGYGVADTVRVFVGTDRPKPATNVKATLNKDLSIALSWSAPTTSVNGGFVDYSQLRYDIIRNGDVIETGHEGTTYTYAVPSEEPQKVYTFKVVPVTTDNQKGDTAIANSIVSGTPLSLPYKESFANASFTQAAWHQDGSNHAFEWTVMGDDEDNEVATQDTDGGMLRSETTMAYSGDSARYISPILYLDKAYNPVLTFYFFHAQSPWYDPEMDGAIDDHLQVQVSVDGGKWTDVENAIFYNGHDNDGWVKCQVTLPRYEGSFVNIGLLALPENDVNSYRDMYVDNISIDETPYKKDLAIAQFSVDEKRIDAGNNAIFTVVVNNHGVETAKNYSVKLYKDKELFAKKEDLTIDAGQQGEVKFVYTASLADATQEKQQWTAEIVYDGDEQESNNTADTLSTSVRTPNVPVVEGVKVEKAGNEISLTWNAAKNIPASTPKEPVSVTDGFESYEPFIIDSIGQWTMYDIDKSTTLNSPRIPNDYPHRGEPMAFQVFNPEEAGSGDDYALAPHSGKQYLLCPATDYPAENDDWLVSPRLDPRAQTISFWGKAASFDAEWIRVYYSTTDRHPDSFKQISEGSQVYVHDGWEKFEYALPEGVRYFAVRCVRRSVFLLLDDFTYNRHDSTPDPATLIGYNVYANDIKLNGNVLTTNSFTTALPASDTRYNVTAVYKEGESAYSAPTWYNLSSISQSHVTSNTVWAEGHTLHINATTPQTIQVYAADGSIVYTRKQATEMSVYLPQGVFIVKVGLHTYKVKI